MGADVLDGAFLHIAGDTKVAFEGFVAIVGHLLQLTDGDVVAFAVAGTGDREVDNGAEDDDCGDDETRQLLLVFHSVFSLLRWAKIARLERRILISKRPEEEGFDL